MTTPPRELSTICGFGMPDSVSLCMTRVAPDRKHFCGDHEGLQCVHCKGRAVGYCGALGQDGVGRCAQPLCERCEHRAGGTHARKASVRDTARQELIASVEMTLDDLEADGHIVVSDREAAARLILDRLSMHITMKVLSGMAQPPN